MAALVRLMDMPTVNGPTSGGVASVPAIRCRELLKARRCWLLRLLAALRTATTLGLCGLTFELTPTDPVGAVSPVRDDAGRPRTGLTAPAGAGRGVERGVRPHRGAPTSAVVTHFLQLPVVMTRPSAHSVMTVVVLGLALEAALAAATARPGSDGEAVLELPGK